MDYYEIIEAGNLDDSWELGVPRRFQEGKQISDVWAFSAGRWWAQDTALEVPIEVSGAPLTFTFTHYLTPVVTREIADVFSRISANGIQRIPATIHGNPGYEILNVLRTFDCIDHQRSKITYYPQLYPTRPEYSGKPESVLRLVIKVVESVHIFRVQGWQLPIIVSEAAVNELRAIPRLGIAFEKVTTPE